MPKKNYPVDYAALETHREWLTYFCNAFKVYGDVTLADLAAKAAVEMVFTRASQVEVPEVEAVERPNALLADVQNELDVAHYRKNVAVTLQVGEVKALLDYIGALEKKGTSK
jgi:hypothetical protein